MLDSLAARVAIIVGWINFLFSLNFDRRFAKIDAYSTYCKVAQSLKFKILSLIFYFTTPKGYYYKKDFLATSHLIEKKNCLSIKQSLINKELKHI